MKVEEQLVKGRGWLEFSVYPLYSPQSLIAEGTANYGIDLAFPDKTRPDTERDVLMPLAEIEPPANDRYWRLLDAMKALQGARLTIAQRSEEHTSELQSLMRISYAVFCLKKKKKTNKKQHTLTATI